MGEIIEDWSVSADLCCPLSLDRDRLDCELALLKYRTTQEVQDNLILIYLNMPSLGYPISQLELVKVWRTILCEELVKRKPIHWRHFLKSRMDKNAAEKTSVDEPSPSA
jgi:hypothetical protein